LERDIGFEPTTFSLGRDGADIAAGGSGLQAVENIGRDGARGVQGSSPVAPVSRDFATRLLPGSVDGPLGLIRGGVDRLLSVREAAEQLGLCTATVYSLCAAGVLAHVRILNAIRIAPRDLRAFVAARRAGGDPGSGPV
jgi:excisionase family DNA binding protein